jgi:excisionase family DNA binding protein
MRIDGHEFWTVKEAAAFLRVTQDTVRTWLKQGKFPGAIRVGAGKRGRIPRHAVLAQCEVYQPPATLRPLGRVLSAEQERAMYPTLAEYRVV